MKIVFVTYGDRVYKYARKRIEAEARQLRIFDEFYIYTEKDLPDYIKNSPLMAFDKGGGYWIWKPFVIWNTLKQLNAGDVIFYADAGCTLKKSKEWAYYINALQEGYNGILFQYKNQNYNWWYENKSPLLKYWTKKGAAEYFDSLGFDRSWQEEPQLVAGAFFVKKTYYNALINDWYRLALFNPYLFTDELIAEKSIQIEGYNNHRHDLSIFSILGLRFKTEENYLILTENMEECSKENAIRTTRLKDINPIIEWVKSWKNK